jgi:hypothetical protein
MQAIVSSVMSIFFYAMVIAGLWKLFQVATDLGEIKNLLTEMRREAAKPVERVPSPTVPTPPPVLAGPISLESAEALLREVAEESHALAAAERPKASV